VDSPVKKNTERFARIDLDLSDCEKERTHYCCSSIGSAMSRPGSDFSRCRWSRNRGLSPQATPTLTTDWRQPI